jgi:hypothetical protein
MKFSAASAPLREKIKQKSRQGCQGGNNTAIEVLCELCAFARISSKNTKASMKLAFICLSNADV